MGLSFDTMQIDLHTSSQNQFKYSRTYASLSQVQREGPWQWKFNDWLVSWMSDRVLLMIEGIHALKKSQENFKLCLMSNV